MSMGIPSKSDIQHIAEPVAAMVRRRPAIETGGLHGRSIAVALDLLQDYQAVRPQLDEIAARLDRPVDEIREIFPDPQAVLIAAAEQALVRLMDNCTKAVVRVDPDDAVAQFCALGDAYLEWAQTYPVHFRLMSDQQLLDTLGTPQLRRYLNSLSELMTRMLERAQEAGNLPQDENIALMVLSSRSFAYGLARMVVDQRMGEWYPDMPPLESAKLAMRDFVRRFARGSLRRSTAP
ncbi:WHG domain-containing protein [Paracoccus sp. R12_1]|jgi:AcrR family transcriptional regulator|uniref:TetR-like C-terminal domain-containing protein n=1 Tax=Paracoccus sp. TaxID=267 RepID=UPI001B0305BD|nr:WHG domain-containing protein [Paracoccus sp. R12_1]